MTPLPMTRLTGIRLRKRYRRVFLRGTATGQTAARASNPPVPAIYRGAMEGESPEMQPTVVALADAIDHTSRLIAVANEVIKACI